MAVWKSEKRGEANGKAEVKTQQNIRVNALRLTLQSGRFEAGGANVLSVPEDPLVLQDLIQRQSVFGVVAEEL